MFNRWWETISVYIHCPLVEHIKTQKTNVNTSVYSEVNEKTKQALSTLKAGDQLQIKWSFGWFHENSVQAGKLIQSEKKQQHNHYTHTYDKNTFQNCIHRSINHNITSKEYVYTRETETHNTGFVTLPCDTYGVIERQQ